MRLPVILRPKYMSWKNRWLGSLSSRTQLARDVFLAVFSVAMMLGIYLGTTRTLWYIRAQVQVIYLPPSIPLGVFLLMVLAILLFANLAAAFGALFLGNDLDLIIASPIRPFRLYWGKLTEILISSAWMPIAFGLPAIVALGRSYNGGWDYYLSSPFVLMPYFFIPSALAILVVMAFVTIVPPSRAREVLLVLFGATLLAVYYFAKLIISTAQTFNNVNDLLRLMSILSTPNSPWVPSYWSATALSEMLEPTGKGVWNYVLLLYSVAICLIALGYLLFRLFYFRLYSRAKSTRHIRRWNSRILQRRLELMTPFFSRPLRAIVGKEYKLLSRDMTQAMQLVILVGICLTYLYHFRILQSVEGLPDTATVWWQTVLIICNVGVGSFVIAAASTRFVFPSISLEGSGYWIVQTSPLGLDRYLRSKFVCWVIPMTLIAAVILAAGSLAIRADGYLIAMSAISGWLICYGLVGVGVGLGACFANFNWENPSQLAASFGSLVYMLTSTVLIALDMIPTLMLLLLNTAGHWGWALSPFKWGLCLFWCILLLGYMNFAAARWALKLGENSLSERMR